MNSIVAPDVFIPVAEESGLIGRIDEWVLRNACQRLAASNEKNGSSLRLAVNLSPRDLRRTQLVPAISEALAETGLPPNLLEIELTETTVIADFESSRRVLEAIRALGVGVVLDDFGTGYASLSHLHGLPVDRVKIDRSFVTRCEEDEDAAKIVAALVGLARNMRLGSVAEGIETAGQAAFLRELGCDEAQGHYFAKAAPAHLCPALSRRTSDFVDRG